MEKELVEVLENKIIKVRPIVRSRSFFKKGHDGEFMYTGCRRIYGLPYDVDKRSFFNPFLKKGEQESFEELLNQKPGSLNLYNFKSEFWGKFNISLDKDGADLNLMNPSDALVYRILLVSPKFAVTDDEKDIPECEYMLVDEREEEKVVTLKAEITDKAMDFMYKLKKSKAKMYDVLRLLGKKPDINADISWFKTELYRIISESGNKPGVVGIKQFIEVMEDPIMDVKVFALNAIDSGEITQSRDGYRIQDSNSFLGKDIQNVYDHFAQNTPEVKEQRLIIEQRMK